eukprot:9503958-Pyramimonas_sp.AAC.1
MKAYRPACSTLNNKEHLCVLCSLPNAFCGVPRFLSDWSTLWPLTVASTHNLRLASVTHPPVLGTTASATGEPITLQSRGRVYTWRGSQSYYREGYIPGGRACGQRRAARSALHQRLDAVRIDITVTSTQYAVRLSPYEHIYIERIFEPRFYKCILAQLPPGAGAEGLSKLNRNRYTVPRDLPVEPLTSHLITEKLTSAPHFLLTYVLCTCCVRVVYVLCTCCGAPLVATGWGLASRRSLEPFTSNERRSFASNERRSFTSNERRSFASDERRSFASDERRSFASDVMFTTTRRSAQ